MPKRHSKNKRSRRWIFVINNPSEDVISSASGLPFKDSASHYCVQLESGDDGTPHLQGFVSWINAKTFKATKPLLWGAHIEAAKGTLKRNKEYCSKAEGRLRGPWFHGFPTPRPLPTELYPWQIWATEIVSGVADDRTIYWIFEEPGGSGKSALQLIWERDFHALFVGFNARDVKCAIKLAWFKDDAVPPDNPIIMINLPRNTQNRFLWPLLEELKDGLIFSGKYESGQCLLPRSHVVVFANEVPLRPTISRDKLYLFRIDHADLSMRPADIRGKLLFGPGF